MKDCLDRLGLKQLRKKNESMIKLGLSCVLFPLSELMKGNQPAICWACSVSGKIIKKMSRFRGNWRGRIATNAAMFRPVGDTAGGRWRWHDPLLRRWASAMCDSSQRHSVTADYKSGNWLKSIDQMGSRSCTHPEKDRCWPCSPRVFLAPRPKEGIWVACKYRIILMFPPLTISDLSLQRCRHWIYISLDNLCFLVKAISWRV